MEIVVILSSALSRIDMANIKEFNREHHSITVVVVSLSGYSERFKLPEDRIKTILSDIPSNYVIFN